ncbi:TPA: signal peptidase II [Candidatus Poribacteria bacterium]|jgi:signal peptidase II|nr:signal peptidase II [Candidatus Poribacteria bacterium]HIA70171.1 signal peptidase II [Candidatus Poribacteria bacterium]HIB89506.1 signal peptidase II [Candidatus Poribacteria bacterium]HIC01738.1 signal peptidase II [Candidatus Poribacteria bacterium]HIC16782.1 signal peptidase II [Candidatus Poribacteria bacterium]
MEKNYFRPIIPLFGISILIICLDQLTKTIIKQRIDYYDQIVVIEGFFNLRHDRNSGAAFSLMQGQRTLLIAATILAMLFIAYYYFQFRHSLWMRVGLGFILGGAIGNLIDRIQYGEVIDFLQFGILPKYKWPTFNTADTAICIGAGMLIIYTIRNRKLNFEETIKN